MTDESHEKLSAGTDEEDSSDQLAEMSFLDHLEELRKVVLQSAIAFIVFSIACWFVSDKLIDSHISSLPVENLYFTKPMEGFMAQVKVSFVLGALIAFPFILYKIWSFVAPGLFLHERKKLYPLVLASSILFYTGVLFCYFVLTPIVLRILINFQTEYMEPWISVSAHFLFVAQLCFTFGLVFQLPIVVLVLSLMGLITPRTLLRHWRYGVVAVVVASAVLTPPDPISLGMMAVPVLLLYIGSVVVAMIVVRKRKKEE